MPDSRSFDEWLHEEKLQLKLKNKLEASLNDGSANWDVVDHGYNVDDDNDDDVGEYDSNVDDDDDNDDNNNVISLSRWRQLKERQNKKHSSSLK